MDWSTFVAAFGLYLVFEGLMSFASPDAFKQFLKQIIELPSPTLRTVGAVSILTGLVLLYFAR